MNWKEKTIVVTGAASGMGRATTAMLRAEGAQVYAADWNRESLEQVCQEHGAIPCEFDIRRSTECDQLLEAA